jgi:hypothetical protein
MKEGRGKKERLEEINKKERIKARKKTRCEGRNERKTVRTVIR